MNNVNIKTVGSIVADDYRNASVFKKYGIDFCCNGNKTLDEVCELKNIEKQIILDELEKITQYDSNDNQNFKNWPLDLLTDYIEKKHHRYVTEKTPLIIEYLEKICSVHGKQHPELFKIKKLFQESAVELAAHMKKEELILFPYIRKTTKNNSTPVQRTAFNSVKMPISVMKSEHNKEGERFNEISQLTNNYTPPSDACNTYKVTYHLLNEFENDLHLHIHLENNILFPGAILLDGKQD
ncbi:MAG: iron-sulfur cluster repair di-iron protein [Bacteroidia bacterium]|nr:iron-sulfur cluster repair di-iron protein [Bacteroidia bacterium]